MSRASFVLAALITAAAASPAAADPARDYVVRAGDSCLGIAVRELGGRAQLDALHRANPQLGNLPHALTPGQVLRLPATTAAPDANLSFQRGVVEIRRAGQPDWTRTATGADLFRAWRVGSRERSTAQVTFADRSLIAMRENTVVVIYGPAQAAARVAEVRATLETGALRTRLGELDGRLLVTTPSSEATLGNGSAVVEVDGGITRVSNHRGKPARIASRTRARKQVAVAPGYGAQVARGAEPSAPRKLPASPAWDAAPLLVLGWQPAGAVVRAAWTPVPGARYRLELARDAGLTQVELRADAPTEARALELRDVPVGDYWLSIIAIDAAGFESAPAAARAVRVVALALPADASERDGAIQLAHGAELALPTGLACTLDGAAIDRVRAPAGRHALACRDDAGARTELALEVAAAPAPPPAPAPAPPPPAPAPIVAPAPARAPAWLALDVIAGLGEADRGDGSRGRIGLAFGAAATRWIALELAAWRPLASHGDTQLRAGIALRLPGLGGGIVEPQLRAGGTAGARDGDGGGYLGAGLALRIAPRLRALIVGDVLRDGDGTTATAGLGLRVDLQ